MYILPYTYSLGSESKFSELAAMCREEIDGVRNWRKVSRMVMKYNIHLKNSGVLEAMMYIAGAIGDTKLPMKIKHELAEVFNRY